jgi:hypothetical protein
MTKKPDEIRRIEPEEADFWLGALLRQLKNKEIIVHGEFVWEPLNTAPERKALMGQEYSRTLTGLKVKRRKP